MHDVAHRVVVALADRVRKLVADASLVVCCGGVVQEQADTAGAGDAGQFSYGRIARRPHEEVLGCSGGEV